MLKHCNNIIAMVFCAFFAMVNNSTANESKVDSVLFSDIEESVIDMTSIGQGLMHASGESLFEAGIVLGSSLAFMPFDEDLQQFALRNYPRMYGTPLTFANNYGELMYPALGTVGIYGIGLAIGDEQLRKHARKTMTSLLVAGLMTTALKSTVGRSRPFNNEGSTSFTPFTIDDTHLSFPSGHTTVAFVMSASLSKYINRWWADIALYGLAVGTAYARMHNDRHWFSDTILGGALGYFATQWVFDADPNPELTTTSAYRITPLLAPNSLGMIVTF
jgi:membrane-associated phospholipid phosphatase